MPTHIKHNSSKIITIIINITYTIENITWTFCTISFKLAIGPNISKEFLRSIGLFIVQFLKKLAIDRVQWILVIDRKKFLWNFSIDRKFFHCTGNKLIDRKNSFEILGPITSLKEIVQKVHVMLSMVYVIVIMIVIILLLLCFMWVGKKFFFSFLLYVLVSYWLTFIQKW